MCVRVLFVCVGNTCRSQIAEAIARDLGYDAFSAGTDPRDDGKITENALKVLEEAGLETADLYSKSLDSFDSEKFDKIISMGCGVSCPAIEIDQDWGLKDPHGEDLEVFRKTRDKIHNLVSKMMKSDTDA
ncbi:MAG: low molecular weight phosphatase family protein [Euryarchaeota archaeon]|nr:low molecular weight phosphatase family protein [Euryarchaeota archaeon]